MASFSTVEALGALSKSIPDWSQRLDELNAQIALGQIELARLTDNERPPTRSLRNTGSTESLRPNDGDNEGAHHDHEEQADGFQLNPFETPPRPNQTGTLKRTSSSAAARAAAMTPPHSKDSPRPQSNPNKLASHSTQPTPPGRIGLRKRKTDSVASGGSNAPKYRTRSMIIVYYDSAAQTAFEEMVKFVSGSRNAMRKGKMNAKMAAMRKAAELEVDEENTDDDPFDAMLKQTNLRSGMRTAAAAVGKDKTTYTSGGLPLIAAAADADADADDTELTMSALKFISTRNMGPPRMSGTAKVDSSGKLSTAMLGRYGMHRNSGSETPNIFDELDKGLEWCQGQCERAAHQSLRDGDCSDEIASIKKRLIEVKAASDREIARLQKEEAETPTIAIPRRDVLQPGKSRELKTPQMRREVEPVNHLEVDVMEVDDEGVDDLDVPPLVFQRSRDVGRR